MAMDKNRYPPNWNQISRERRERAGWKCEWCGAAYKQPHPITGSIVVLSVAHLGTPYPDGTPGDKHDKMDVRDENLAALCQRCHLLYDIDEHTANRKQTLARKKHNARIAAGQRSMTLKFEE
jgi:hypothetical protein